MDKLRNFMRQNPMAGWVVASLLMLFAAAMLYTRIFARTEAVQLTELVTIRDTETGDTWQVPRGVMEKELWLRPYPVDPNQGLINPKTGKRTGFPVDAWKQTVESINKQHAEASSSRHDAKTPTPPPSDR